MAVWGPQVKENKRYKGAGKFTMSETAAAVGEDFGKIDVLVHSLANGPEVTKPLLETSRAVCCLPTCHRFVTFLAV